MLRLADRSDTLAPAEDLLDAPALPSADFIARVAGRSGVPFASTVAIVLGNVRRDIEVPQCFDVFSRGARSGWSAGTRASGDS